MAKLSVTLLGPPAIDVAGQSVSKLPVKSMELVSFLVLHPDRAYARDTLSSILWPDEDAVSGKRFLRQALWKLNAALDRRAPEAEPVAADGPGRLRMNPRAPVWADVRDFETVHAASHDVPGQELDEAQAQALERAVELYRGDLLTGWEQEWCLPDRIRLEQAYLFMLEQLMAHCEQRRQYAKGISLGRLVLNRDRTRETTHRQLMRLHHRSGNRPAAIRQYQECAGTLAREFRVRPSGPTVDLYRQVCADEPELVARSLPLARSGPENYATLSARLDEIQASLQELMRLVGRENG